MFQSEQIDGREGILYRKALSLCMRLSGNDLFWESNLRRRNTQNSHLVCTRKWHYPFKNRIKCMKNDTESSRTAWCFNWC